MKLPRIRIILQEIEAILIQILAIVLLLVTAYQMLAKH